MTEKTMDSRVSYGTCAEVGIDPASVSRLLDRLENGGCEPHGLIMMRHGKVFAKGWWKPYAPGMIHGMQSLSKTYTATAVGLAVTDGLLSLEDRVVDFFKDYTEKKQLQKEMYQLSIRHLLMMSSGMMGVPSFEGDWIRNFLEQPIENKPGTVFFYNSAGTTLLGEIIRRVTGMGLEDYLEKRLFQKMDMDLEHIQWMKLPDGLEIGGSGLYTTLENNLKLAMLYLNEGLWNKEQLLSRDFVREAMSIQVDNRNAESLEGSAGYGFQMWKCSYKDAWRMDGAMGQYAIICPCEDMIIVFCERLKDMKPDCADKVLGEFWDFMDNGILSPQGMADKIDAHGAEQKWLEQKTASLSLPGVLYNPQGDMSLFTGCYKVIGGMFSLVPPVGGIMAGCFPQPLILSFQIEFGRDICRLYVTQEDKTWTLDAGMDGLARTNSIQVKDQPITLILASAAFTGPQELTLHIRWPQTCYCADYKIKSDAQSLTMAQVYPDLDPAPETEHTCVAVKINE